MTRDRLCERLRLGLRQSYRLVGSSYGGMIDSDRVVDYLNGARRHADPLTGVPSDLATPEEAVEAVGLDGVTPVMLTTWCRRTRNPPPHFRLNGHTIRFSTSALSAWLACGSRPRRTA